MVLVNLNGSTITLTDQAHIDAFMTAGWVEYHPAASVETPKEEKYTAESLGEMSVKQIKKIASDKGIELKKVVKADVIAEFLKKVED